MASSDQPKSPASPTSIRPARFREALIPVVALIVMIYVSVVRFDASAHIALILAAAVASGVGLWIGHSWKVIEKGLVDGIAIGLKAILILLVVGMLIATWIQSGIVPVMIYYGLNLLSPGIFLAAACLISGMVGVRWVT